MDQLTTQQFQQTMRRPPRNPAAQYMALPPDKRVAFLDKQIEEEEARSRPAR